MTYLAKPKLHHPTLAKNQVGYTRRDYEGKISTLCAGCGHDSISAAIVQACWELDIEPHRVAKLSGIGCSSKTPDYFLGNSHGFNSVHGRMPSVLTGANLANRDLLYLGVSGDGDSASIGIGQFAHCDAARRQHGLHRREQRRLRPHQGPVLRHRRQGLEVQARHRQQRRAARHDRPGAAARRDLRRAQLLRRQAAARAAHQGARSSTAGAAFIDVISPCVAFNNHAGSTKSYEYVREHNEAVNRLDFIEGREEITADYAAGTVIDVTQHDGSVLRLRKLAEDYDPTDRIKAMNYLQERAAAGEVVTGPALRRARRPPTSTSTSTPWRRRSTS